MHFPSSYWENGIRLSLTLYFVTPSIISRGLNFVVPFSVSAMLIHFCMLYLQISLLGLLYGIPLLEMGRLFFLQFFLA
jgi:hypothetical protein